MKTIMTKAIAMAICVIMLVSCIPFAAFAGKKADDTVKVTQDGGVFTVSFPASAINKIVEKRSITKADLLAMLPDGLYEAYQTGSIVELLTCDTVKDMVSPYDLINSLPTELADEVITAENLEKMISLDSILSIAPTATILNDLTADQLQALLDFASITTAQLDSIGITAVLEDLTTPEVEAIFGAGYNPDGKSTDTLVADADKAALATVLKNHISELSTADLVSAVGFKKIIKTIGVTKLLSYINKAELMQAFKAVNKSGVKQVASAVLANILAQPDIQLNGVSLFNENYDISVNAIKSAVLKSLPRIATFQNVSNESDNVFFSLILNVDMDDASYTGDVELGIKLAVYGTDDELATLAAHADNIADMFTVATEYVDPETGSEYDMVAFINISSKYTKYIVKALETTRISDRKKAAILKLINGTFQDAIDRFGEFTVDDIAEIIANYDTPVTEKVISVTMAHKEKAEKVLNYVNSTLNAVPEEYRNLSICDYYFMLGTFMFVFTGNTSVDAVITRVTSAFAALAPVANIFDTTETVTSNVVALAVIEDLRMVRFVNEDEEVVFKTFLPVGADVSLVTKLIPELASENWVTSHNEAADKVGEWDTTYYNFDTEYTVTFNDISGSRTVNYFYDEWVGYDAPEITEKFGYDAQWYIAGTNTLFDETYITKGDYTVEARYTEQEFYITFRQENGKETVLTYTYGTNKLSGKVPMVNQKEGYLGIWSPYKLNTERYLVVTPKYISSSLVYAVIFQLNANDTTTVYYEKGSASIVEPDVPYRFGYKGEWSEYVLNVAETTIVTPIYTPLTFKVTFEQEDGTKTEVTYTYGDDSIKVPAVNEKEGYTAKWADFELNKSAEITVKPVYTAKTYNVVFVQEDGTSKTVEYTYGAKSIEEPAVADKTGYTGAWEAYALNSAETVTVKAVYTPKTYTVTFCFEDGTTKDVKYTYGAKSIEEPAIPAKQGYIGEWEAYTLNAAETVKVNVKYTVDPATTTTATEATTEATTEPAKKGCKSTIGIGAAVVAVVTLVGTGIAVSKKQDW